MADPKGAGHGLGSDLGTDSAGCGEKREAAAGMAEGVPGPEVLQTHERMVRYDRDRSGRWAGMPRGVAERRLPNMVYARS